MKMRGRLEQNLGIAALALVVIGCTVVLLPFISALLWAAVVCYCTWPCFMWLTKVLGGRKNLAAFIMLVLVALVLVVPFAVAGFMLAGNAPRLVEVFRDLVREGLPEVPEWLGAIPVLGPPVEQYWQHLGEHPEQVTEFAHRTLVSVRAWLFHRGVDLGHGVLQMTLSVLITFFFYRDGEHLVVRITDGIKRIAGEQTQHLLHLTGQTVKGVVYGVIGTALAQGILAGIGFRVAGVPSSGLLGMITFIVALVPFGPPFVWAPIALWLFFERSVGSGIGMAIYGLLVVSGVDNVLRPYLISRGSKLSFVPVLLGVLGGILAFGFIGLFLGPTLLAVGYSLLDEWISGKLTRPSPAGRTGGSDVLPPMPEPGG